MTEQNKYHIRRMEKAITSPAEMLDILRGQKFLTLAMCEGGRPYQVSMNYAFDERERCFYAHCAPEGRKIGILRANPAVWGQVVEDRGYVVGKCEHSYRTVGFEGEVEFVDDLAERRRALEAMIDSLDPDSAPLKAKLTDKVCQVTQVLRIKVLAMTAKQSPPPETPKT